MSALSMIEVRNLRVIARSGRVVLDGLSIDFPLGGVTAIVGESGSGKSTLLNCILGLLPEGLEVSGGEVIFNDPRGGGPVDLLLQSDRDRRAVLGRKIGYVPQDGRSGLDPLMRVRDSVLEAVQLGADFEETPEVRTDAALLRAGLSREFLENDAARRPSRLSGGQCQRIQIAQAIVNQPPVILMDEPIASLDPLARLDVLATVKQLSTDRTTIVLVTHDLRAAAAAADRIAVMYLGRVIETGPAAVLWAAKHPYTKGLIACLPRIAVRLSVRPIPGEAPDDLTGIPGCKFHPRCEECIDLCRLNEPQLRDVGDRRKAACHVV
jgi:oligopeptide/dipeptide ABC transporter ATP-binding protein